MRTLAHWSPTRSTRRKRSGTGWHEDWSLTALGFLETSLGNYDAALNALEPLLSRYGAVAEPHRDLRGVVCARRGGGDDRVGPR